jgi:hypothetical protein
MKRLIFILIPLLFFVDAYAQEPTQGNFPGAYRFKNRLYIDTLLLLPNFGGLSPIPLRDGAVRYNPDSGYIQLWKSGRWNGINGSGGGGGSQNLQSVTTVGNATTYVVSLTGADNLGSSNYDALHLGKGFMFFGNPIAGTFSNATIQSGNMSVATNGGTFNLTSGSASIGATAALQMSGNQITLTSNQPVTTNQPISGVAATQAYHLVVKNQLDSASLTGANGINVNSGLIKIGGNITEPSTVNITGSNNLRFTRSGPTYMEFARTDAPGTVGNTVASFGMHGNPEANVCLNMLYLDGVHRLYDTTKGAMWLAVGAGISALQYAYPTTSTSDVWSLAGAPYAWWTTTARGDAQMAINNSISTTTFDANLMIKRTALQSSISGYTDLLLSGHRTKGTAGSVYIAPYDTGRIYLASGLGRASVGTINSGDGTLLVSRTGVQPSITGDAVLIIEGHRLKGVAGDVYLNAYNAGNSRLSDGGGTVIVNGGSAGDSKLMITRPANGVSLSGATDIVIEGHATKGTSGPVYINQYNSGNTYVGVGGGTLNIGTLSGSGDKLHVQGNATFTGGQLSMTNIVSNNYSFGSAGTGIPSFTTASTGEKIKFYNTIDGTHANYAAGVGISTLWFGVPTTSEKFDFYGGTTKMFTIQNAGIGVGVSTPLALMHLAGTGTLARYGYDATDYLDIMGSSTGNTTFTAQGSSPQITMASLTNLNGGVRIAGGNPGIGKFLVDSTGTGWGVWRNLPTSLSSKYDQVKKAITSNITLDTTSTNWIIDCSGGNITVTLPDATASASWISTGSNQGYGVKYFITRSDNTANVLTIQTTSSQSIDGAATFSLYDNNSFLNIFSDGSNWRSK